MDSLSDSTRRPPPNSRPRPLPGRSVHGDVAQKLWKQLLPYLFFAAVMTVMALVEWLASTRQLPRQPWLYTAVAVAALAVAAFKFWRTRAQIDRLKMGRDGARAVGEFLERLRGSAAAEVFHDVPGDGFTVDHVVLCRKGFFAIETQTHRKPAQGDARIALTREGLLVDGRIPDSNPIRQAQAGAGWLAQLLEESTGKRFAVRGVVLYPGWFVDPMDTAWRCDFRQPLVLEPKSLPGIIAREPRRLTDGDVKLAAYHLARYARIVGSQTQISMERAGETADV